jgi:hypothetical protein
MRESSQRLSFRQLKRVIHRLWCPSLPPLIEKFDVWGPLKPDSKLLFYSGWANGLFTTTKDPGTLVLGRCLEKLSFQQSWRW